MNRVRHRGRFCSAVLGSAIFESHAQQSVVIAGASNTSVDSSRCMRWRGMLKELADLTPCEIEAQTLIVDSSCRKRDGQRK